MKNKDQKRLEKMPAYFIVNGKHMNFTAVFFQFTQWQPLYPTVFFRTDLQRRLFIGRQQIRWGNMQMGADELSFFYMGSNRKQVKGKHTLLQRQDVLQAGFFFGFPQCGCEKIGFAVTVSAGPAPGLIDFVENKEHLIFGLIDDKGRACHMNGCVFPGKNVSGEFFQQGQDAFFVGFFLHGFGW